MDQSLRAGIAVYNAGATHAAHDAWENRWLELNKGTDDERLLHGLIQFTAAVYHAEQRNWSGAVGLAESAQTYLTGLPEQYRNVDLTVVREYLRRLEVDPERIERAGPPPLNYKRQPLAAADLAITEIILAAETIADDTEAYDGTVIEQAADWARQEVDSADTEFIGLLVTFVDERRHRDIVYSRLVSQVERRQQRQQDVSGLFEPRHDE